MKNVRSLGYILGDEGSAAYIGKRFLSDCLKDIAQAAYEVRKEGFTHAP